MDNPRRVKIGTEERTGWSSERPVKEGETPRGPLRPPARVLEATTDLTYSPRSLIIVCGAEEDTRSKLLRRLFPSQLLLSTARVAKLIAEKVPAQQLDAAAEQLFLTAVRRRLVTGSPTVIEA